MFVNKAGAYYNITFEFNHLNFPAEVRIGYYCLRVVNTLAYFSRVSVREKKSFVKWRREKERKNENKSIEFLLFFCSFNLWHQILKQ